MSGKSKKNASVKNVEAIKNVDAIVENEVAVIELTIDDVFNEEHLDGLESLISLTKTENRGRHVDLSSARQIRFATKAALEALGMLPGRGRKVNFESERQIRLNAFATKWANSEVKRGRPKLVKPTLPEVNVPTEVPAEVPAAE